MNLRTVSWVLYIVGFGIVILQWIGVVSFSVGMVGWGVCMIGWAMGFLPGVKRATLSDEIAKLDEQRKQGLVTDDEFATLKARLIGPS